MLGDDFARSEGDPSLVGRFVRLTVSDTGTGMDATTIEHAFEPFFTTKASEAGTGLGLATVYGIVTGAGGHIAIASDVGLGTTIRVHLPMATSAPEADAPTRERHTVGAAAGERILVVEDDGNVRALADRILRRAGYAVAQATGAVEALERMAADEPFDLVLTDVLMPGLSGYELADRVAELDRSPGVLFMSGYAADTLAGRAARDTAATLLKPFTAAELLVAVRRELNRATAA